MVGRGEGWCTRLLISCAGKQNHIVLIIERLFFYWGVKGLCYECYLLQQNCKVKKKGRRDGILPTSHRLCG